MDRNSASRTVVRLHAVGAGCCRFSLCVGEHSSARRCCDRSECGSRSLLPRS